MNESSWSSIILLSPLLMQTFKIILAIKLYLLTDFCRSIGTSLDQAIDKKRFTSHLTDKNSLQKLIISHQNLHINILENLSLGFPSRSNTKWAVKPQKMARGLKFWI